ncbi:MAG: septum formation protein Maf [Acetobacteraceae bacterium]|nr:septum formation protein Maf [Acetobacteraceae bacterium]
MKLILASQSPYRAGLLRGAGIPFTAMPAYIDEGAVKHAAILSGQNVAGTAMQLARLKAEKITRDHPDVLVIGGDQILVCGNDWFDKPVDSAEARSHLRRLRNRTHRLVTATICLRGNQNLWQHVEEPLLTMRDFSDAFLDSYLTAEGHHATTTVGAYRLEDQGIQLFERIDGHHSAILGLPLLPLLGFLRRIGYLPN